MATYGTFNDGVTLTAAEANDIGVWYLAATPVIRQSSSVAIQGGASFIRYTKMNKLVFLTCKIALNASGTSNTRIEVDIPLTAASGDLQVVGSGYFYDASANDGWRLQAVQYSTTRFAFLTEAATATTNYFGTTNGTNIALAFNDILFFNAMFEAA